MSHVPKYSEIRKRRGRRRPTSPFPTKEEKARLRDWMRAKGLLNKWKSL